MTLKTKARRILSVAGAAGVGAILLASGPCGGGGGGETTTTTVAPTTTTTIAPTTTTTVFMQPKTCDSFGSQVTFNQFVVNQVQGSIPTLINSSTPIFTLVPDGGLATYTIKVDNQDLGIFHNNTSTSICIQSPTPLSDGSHVISGVEVAPRPVQTVTPLTFTVDTVGPPAPSAPTIVGIITGAVSFKGTASYPDAFQIHIFDELGHVVGGATVNTDGTWFASVRDTSGSHTFTPNSVDKAGNRTPGPSLQVTIP